MWKCIFRSFDLSYPFWQQEISCLTYSVRVHPRGFHLPRLARPKRTLARLIVKVFGIKLTKYKSSISWFFCNISVVGMQIVIIGWIETHYTVQNLHCDNDFEFIPKLRPSGTFSTHRKPSCITQQPYASLYFLFVQIAIDFSQPFIFRL